MSKTITSRSSGLTVSDVSSDPLLITAAGALLATDTNPGLLVAPITNGWIIDNEGTITSPGPYGLAFLSAGTVSIGLTTPTAAVSGAIAGIVTAVPASTIVNDGSINGTGLGAIWLQDGGTIDNGTDTATGARLTGLTSGVYADGAAVSIDNRGTISAGGGFGVIVLAGGSINNGSGVDTQALITGAVDGISDFIGTGTLSNTGTVQGIGAFGALYASGATISNAGLLSGLWSGAFVTGGPASIGNTGSIVGAGLAGLWIDASGNISNGTDATTGATISGQSIGLFVTTGTVALDNRGTISAAAAFGAVLVEGGSVNNGSTANPAATITGPVDGLAAFAGAATLTNYGTVSGTQAFGLIFATGGSVTNAGQISGGSVGAEMFGAASLSNTGAVVGGGGFGAVLANGGMVSNAGLIRGGAGGLQLGGPGSVTNSGVISGTIGLQANGAADVVANAGTIASSAGTSGTALQFTGAGATLRLLAGATFTGLVSGAGDSTLELAASGGTLTGFGTSFTGFATLASDAGTGWTVAGADMLGATGTLLLGGTLTLAAAARLDVEGSIAGSGAIDLGGAGSQVLVLGTAATGGGNGSLATSVRDVGAGDAIVLAGTGATAATVNIAAGSGGVSVVTVRNQTGTVIATLSSVSFAAAGLGFTVSAASGGLTLLAGIAQTTPGRPTVSAALSDDTGVSASDGVTTDPATIVHVSAPAGLAALTATLDGGTISANLVAAVSAGGSLSLTTAQVDALVAGGTLVAGSHLLRLQASDALGQTGTFALAFTIDGGATFALMPSAPYATATGTLSLSGVAKDPNAAISGVTASLDGSAAVAVPSATAAGSFTINTASLFGAASAVGAHDLKLFATTAGGASGSIDVPFTVGSGSPTVTLSTPANAGTLSQGAILSGVAKPGLGSLVGLSYAFDGGTAMPISFDTTSGVFTTALNLSGLTTGSHKLTVTARDSSGGQTTISETETLPALVPLTVTSISPANQTTEIGVTFRPMVTFSRAVDPTTVTSSSFYATDSSGAVVPATIVMSNGNQSASLFFTHGLPAASDVTLNVVGAGIKAAADGTLLDAADTGVAGSLLQSTLMTVSETPVTGTTLTGIIADPGADLTPGTTDDVINNIDGTKTYKLPIAGVTVSVIGDPAAITTTDANGRFTLTNIPAGDDKIEINGLTATNDPAGYYFPQMTMDTTIRAGVTQTLMGSMGTLTQQVADAALQGVYLPRVQTNVLQPVSNTAPTTVTSPVTNAGTLTAQQLSQISLTVQPGSVVDGSGNTMTSAVVGLSPVPSSIVQDMLPPGLLQHTFDITIQSPGAVAFTTPATLTLPNVFGLAPGAKTYFVSFNHTTGKLEIDGTATVSADGQTVTTDPGQGITQPGWHGMTGPGSNGMGNVNTTANPNANLGPAFTNAFDTTTNIFGTTASAISAFNPPGLALPFLNVLSTASDGASLVNDISNGTTGQVVADVGKLTLDVLGFFPPTAVAASAIRALWGAYDFVSSQAPTLQTQINAAHTATQGQTSVDNPFGDTAGGPGTFGATVDPSLLAAVSADLQTIATQAPIQVPIYQQLEADYNIIDPIVAAYDATKPNGGLTTTQIAALNAAATDVAAQAKKLDGLPNLLATIQNLTKDTSAYLNALQQSLQIPQKAEFLTDPVRYSSSNVENAGTINGGAATTGTSGTSNLQPSPIGQTLYGAFKAPDGSIQRFSFRSADQIQYFLAANTTYELTVYDPSTGGIGSTLFQSSASGTNTSIPSVLLAPDSAARGADGLTATQAYVIGVNNGVASNLVAGVTDLAALQEGLYNGTVLPSTTGIVAAVALNGSAQAVVLANSLANTQQSYAFVATGTYGLAIVDVSNPFSPTILSQLQLTGNSTGVAVDLTLGVAVVASGSGGLHFVNIGNAATPTIVATDAVSASIVVQSGGIAYANSGNSVDAFDMATGLLLQTLPTGGTITGITVEGSTLYTMDSSDTLRVFGLSSGAIVAEGSVTLPGGGNGLVVDNGVAYVAAASGTASGGYITVDVSNPAAPKLIEKSDLANLAGSAIAVNGSGIGIGVQQIQVYLQGLTNVADLINTSSPSNTSGFETRFALPAAPAAVAIGNGIGFIADGTSGLQILNYLPPNTSGTPPTISISTLPTDVDPTTAGIQVYAGEPISLGVTVASPVQVRNVELLVNGTVVVDAASAPFDLTTTLPTIAANGGSTTVTVQAEAIDTGGNTTLSPALTLTLVNDLTPLKLLSQSISEGGIVSSALGSINFTFSKPVNPTALAPADFALIGPGNVTIDPTSLVFRANNHSVEAVYPTLAVGSYRLDVAATQVVDVAGIALGTADLLTDFTVQTFTEQFTNINGGDWNTASNWNAGAVPGAADTVLIGLPIGAPVTYGGGTSSVAELVTNTSATLAISGGALAVTGVADLGGTTQISGASLAVFGGATFGTASLSGSGSLVTSGTITDLGTIAISAYFATQMIVAGSATLTGGGSVILSDSGNNQIVSNGAAATLTNVNVAISGAGLLGDGFFTFANQAGGIVDATGNNALIVNTGSNTLTNAGLLEATAGTGGLLIQGTTVANTGTILATGAAAHVDLQSATITGGVLADSAGGLIDAVDRGSILSGVTLAAKSLLAVASESITFRNTLDNLGTVELNAYFATELVASGTLTLAGGGAVSLSDSANNEIVTDGTNAATLNNVNNVIAGAGSIGDALMTLVNQAAGTIDATGNNPLVVTTGTNTLTNAGLLESTAGSGGLSVNGSTVANTGTIAAIGAGTSVNLHTATIIGGVLADSGGGVIYSADRGSFLNNVTLSAGSQFAVASNSVSLANTFDNLGTLQLNAYFATDLVAVGTVTLTGGGTVITNDSTNNQIFSNGSAATLINVNNTIAGAGQIGDGILALSNLAAGVIDATLTNALVISKTAVTNTGLLESTGTASNRGGLSISGSTIDNRGTSNMGLILANGATSHVDLSSSTILGGTIETANGGVVNVTDRAVLLNATTLAAGSALQLASSSATLLNVVENGFLALNAYFLTQISVGGTLTLQNAGAVTLNDSTDNDITSNGAAATLLNVNQTISGAGSIGDGLLAVVNQAAGVVDATGGNALVLTTGAAAITNAGLMESTSAGGLVIQGTNVLNTGTIAATGASAHVDLQTATIQGGVLSSSGGGLFRATDRGSVLSGVSITAGSHISIPSESLTLVGTVSNAGSITLDTYFATDLIVAGAVTLQGAGSVIMGDSSNSAILSNGAAATLINAETISGAGAIGDSTLTLVNAAGGLIEATGSNALTIATAGVLANAGTLEAASGGLIVRGAVTNTGKLWANGSGLDVTGAVQGSGAGEISGAGTLELGGAVSAAQTITMDAGDTGALRLDQSQAFAGTVAGLAQAGTNRLDLSDITFISAAATTATFTGTATGGILKVTDGTHTANVALTGNYVGRSFITASDGHNGTLVTDPEAVASGAGSLAGLLQAAGASTAADLTGASRFAGVQPVPASGVPDSAGSVANPLDLGLAAASGISASIDPRQNAG